MFCQLRIQLCRGPTGLAAPWELSWGCLSPGRPQVCSVQPLHMACPSQSMAAGFQEGAFQGLKLRVSQAQLWKLPGEILHHSVGESKWQGQTAFKGRGKDQLST